MPSKEYYWKNRDKCLSQSIDWHKKNKPKGKESKWKQQGIKITHEEYVALFNKQDGKCALCFTPAEELTKSLAVDHSHTTGNIRGLLCGSCNQALGLFKDNIEVMKRALSYLDDNT